MNYVPTLSNKFIVFNSTNQTLIEKLHSSVAAFIFAKTHGWNFRINDTEGIPLVEYFTSKINWWERDWDIREYTYGRLNLLDIPNDSLNLFETDSFNSVYNECDVIHLYSNRDLLNYLDFNKGEDFKNTLLSLFKIENKYYDNFINILERLIMESHLIMNVDDLTYEQSKNLIIKKIKDGEKVFLSGGSKKLVRELKRKYPKYQFKCLTINDNKLDDNSIIDETQVISMIFQIFIIIKLDNKLICNNHIEKFIKDLHSNYETMKYDGDNLLYKID